MLDMFSTDRIVAAALEEDLGSGDLTTLSTVPEDRRCSARFIAKEDGVICGLPVVERVFAQVDPETALTFHCQDGDRIQRGDLIAECEGRARSILMSERVSLNLLQHLSGIATRTAVSVEAVRGTRARITDTRKTTPGLRVLEKYAVRIGGGANHRFNLSDGVLIKDNHIRAAGSITAAVQGARALAPHTVRVEVEVENLDMLREALEAGADIVMLDNMDLDAMRAAVELTAGRALLEASGNMGDRNLAAVAATGVDIISIGALTHSVRALDISLRFND